MNTVTVTALVCLTLGVQLTEGQMVDAVNGGCTCQAVDAEINNMILKNFGIVKHCTGLGDCNCNVIADGNIQTCRAVCEHVVAMWALNNCPMMFRGREVRAQFQSPTCANAVGIMTRDCGVRQCLCPCPAPVMFAPVPVGLQQVQVVGGGGNFMDN